MVEVEICYLVVGNMIECVSDVCILGDDGYLVEDHSLYPSHNNVGYVMVEFILFVSLTIMLVMLLNVDCIITVMLHSNGLFLCGHSSYVSIVGIYSSFEYR